MNHSEFLRKKAANLFSQTNYSYLVPYSNLFYKSDSEILSYAPFFLSSGCGSNPIIVISGQIGSVICRFISPRFFVTTIPLMYPLSCIIIKICSQRSRVTPSRNGLIVSTSNSSQSSAASKYLNIRYMTLKLFIVSLLFVCGGFLGPSPYQHIPLTFANTHLLTGGLHCDGAVFLHLEKFFSLAHLPSFALNLSYPTV